MLCFFKLSVSAVAMAFTVVLVRSHKWMSTTRFIGRMDSRQNPGIEGTLTKFLARGMSSHQQLKKNGDTSQDIDKSSHELLLLLRFGWSYLCSRQSVGHVQGDP